jgi:hypothetical protein
VAFGKQNWQNALNMSEQSANHDRFAFYDRESDIVWLPTGALGDISGERTDWGVLSRDTEKGT